jgi:hypothetical protein
MNEKDKRRLPHETEYSRLLSVSGSGVTERDMAGVNDWNRYSEFVSKFVFPGFYITREIDLSRQIHLPENVVVCGDSGSGRTFLRCMEFSNSIGHRNGRMAVLLTIGNAAGVSGRLADSLSRHLYGAILSNGRSFDYPGEKIPDELLASISELISSGGNGTRLIVRHVAEDLKQLPDNEKPSIVNSPSLRRLMPDFMGSFLRDSVFLDSFLNIGDFSKNLRIDDETRLRMAIETGQLWDYEHIDAYVDAKQIREGELGVLSELLGTLNRAGSEGGVSVGMKLFVPTELKDGVSRIMGEMGKKPKKFELEWSEDDLERLLYERFRAARLVARQLGGSNIVDSVLEEEVDQLIIQFAQGNPRRLVRMLNSVVKSYLQSGQKLTRQKFDETVDSLNRVL